MNREDAIKDIVCLGRNCSEEECETWVKNYTGKGTPTIVNTKTYN